MKSRIGGICATVVLVVVVVLLAVDVGFSLYTPDRLASTLPVCTLNVISGNIQVQTKQALTWEKAEDGMMLGAGSRVRTAPDAHASLTFSQGTTTKLEPGTDVIVVNLEGSGDAQPDAIVLEQRAGRTWNQVAARRDNGGYFQIQTSSADVRVYGTLFSTEVDESGKTLVQTTEGQVNVSAQGQEVKVPAGRQTEVEPGAAPSAPVPMLPARSELVFTIDKPAIGMVIDPSGSRSGYLADGSPLNQISGSRFSPSEESYHDIRIREPETGEYTVVLRGVDDGTSSFTVSGFVEGNSTFRHTGTCNITAANELVLKLHLDVLDGLLQGADLLGLESSEGQPTVIKTTLKTVAKPTEPAASPQESPGGGVTASKEGETSGQKSTWQRQDGAQYVSRIIITVIVAILVVASAVVWRKR